MLAELQDDVLAGFERRDQPVQPGVALGHPRSDERQPLDGGKLPPQGAERLGVRAGLLHQRPHIGVVRGQLLDPRIPEPVFAQAGRLDRGRVQPQLILEQRDVLDLDLVQPDRDLPVRLDGPRPRAGGIQGVDRDLRREELAQPFDHPAALALALPAVLAVHVEDQVCGHAALDRAAQQQPSQKALACPGLAEHAVRALDESLEVQSHRHVHVERLTDLEVDVVGRAEHAREVALLGREDRGEVTWHGPDRRRTGGGFQLIAGEHQHRLDLDRAVRGGAGQDRPQEAVVRRRRAGLDLVARRGELDVGDQAEEVVLLPSYAHEAPDPHVLDRRDGLQPRQQPLDQRPLDNQPQPLLVHQPPALSHASALRIALRRG